MLNLKTANYVMKEINKEFKTDLIDLKSVRKMKPVPLGSAKKGYKILSIQCSDLTILVWIHKRRVVKINSAVW